MGRKFSFASSRCMEWRRRRSKLMVMKSCERQFSITTLCTECKYVDQFEVLKLLVLRVNFIISSHVKHTTLCLHQITNVLTKLFNSGLFFVVQRVY